MEAEAGATPVKPDFAIVVPRVETGVAVGSWLVMGDAKDYERIRSRKGKRYFADVNKLMPVAALCLALIAFMFLTGLYLDVVKS